jgi:hypothetical protein
MYRNTPLDAAPVEEVAKAGKLFSSRLLAAVVQFLSGAGMGAGGISERNKKAP